MTKITKPKKEKLAALARDYALDFIILFGSAARGKTHAQSDLDLAYRSRRDLSPYAEAALQEAACAALGRGDVEMVNVRRAAPLLLREISRDGVVLYEHAPSAFALFRMYAFKRYVEAKPLYALREKQLASYLRPRIN